MMVSACFGVEINPTTRVEIPASCFTLSANGTLSAAT
jgi:hypothetical protein